MFHMVDRFHAGAWAEALYKHLIVGSKPQELLRGTVVATGNSVIGHFSWSLITPWVSMM